MSLPKLKPILNKYYLSSFLKSKKRKKVEWILEPLGKPVALEGLDGIDTFILKETKPDGSYWRISEAYTGFRLYYSAIPETKSDAMYNVLADMRIKKITKKKLENLINAKIALYGLSPRYQ
jgi:hypothetical protein